MTRAAAFYGDTKYMFIPIYPPLRHGEDRESRHQRMSVTFSCLGESGSENAPNAG